MAAGMSSATMATWSMPLVCMALCLQRGEESPQGSEKTPRVLAGNVVTRVDFDDLQAWIGGLHFLFGLGGVHVGARAAHGKHGAAQLADELPHVDAELRPFAGFEQLPELVAEVGVAFDDEFAFRFFQIRLVPLSILALEILHCL